jgi:hypothetical protein
MMVGLVFLIGTLATSAPPCVDPWLHLAMTLEEDERARWGICATVTRHGYQVTTTPLVSEACRLEGELQPLTISVHPGRSEPRPTLRDDCLW